MRINQTQNHKLSQVKLNKLKETNIQKSEIKSDRITISKKALDIKQIKKELAKVPEVREEKIKDLKQKIQLGTYIVPAQAIINKLKSDFDNDNLE
ncbi:MAG: negative regulator of flagellin synthesis FlgM [Halanaerobiales bacterium]|nr:negative regulator of flagellin synthesis FlgM [Halanaerobiales bacterium]